ncbi:MAG: PHP domain-containing protein [Thermodesulfobacteriota bacterium]|nr:PHP domain-containing protein [Thermodesulfobacteriota bacterium]
MKLKLDLHTHCFEAMGFERPTVAVVEKIVDSIRAAGLDGIAITDHNGNYSHYPYLVGEIIGKYFQDQILVIPGREISDLTRHVVELFLPGKLTFRFVAHPGYPISRYWDEEFEDIQGLEINNGQYPIDSERIREVAQRHELLLLSNSDAHRLEDFGKYYNEIDLDDLCKMAGPPGKALSR